MQNSTIIKYLTTFIGSVNSLNLVMHILTHNSRMLFSITKYLQTSFRYILKHANEKGLSAETRAPKSHFQTPCKTPLYQVCPQQTRLWIMPPPKKKYQAPKCSVKIFFGALVSVLWTSPYNK